MAERDRALRDRTIRLRASRARRVSRGGLSNSPFAHYHPVPGQARSIGAFVKLHVRMIEMGSTRQAAEKLRFGAFELDPAKRLLRRIESGDVVTLTPRAFDTLLLLVENHGEIVEKRTLLETVWPSVIVEENSLTQAVSTLRRALGERPLDHQYIVTVPGRGYRFVADVRLVECDAGPAVDAAPHRVLARRAILAGLAGGTIGAAWLISRMGARWGAANSSAGLLSAHSKISVPPGNQTQPTLSPEGSRVAFVNDASGVPQIHAQVIGSGGSRQLTFGENRVSAPNWSPRNDEIIFTQHAANGNPQAIWSVDPLGTLEPRLLIDRATNGSFSQNGEAIVFERGFEIWLANADGTNPRRVEGVPPRSWLAEWTRPALSPGGELIAFYLQDTGPVGDIWIIPSNGGEARPLTGDRQPMGRPVFGPDGRYVYFPARRQGGAWNIWRVPVGGGDPEPVTSGAGEYLFPTLSADGTILVYQNTRTSTRFMLTDSVTGETRALASNGSLSWFPTISRDGTRFAFFSEVNPRERLFVQDTNGSDPIQMTFSDAGVAHIMPGWGPDDGFLYFYEELGDGGLMRVSLEGGAPTDMMPDIVRGPTQAAELSPSGDRLAYVRNSEPPRVIVRNVATGEEQILGEQIAGWPRWSQDGREILGMGRDGVVLCDVASTECRLILSGNDLVPNWSTDESRIFFSRPIPSRPGMLELWVVNRDGTNDEYLFEIGPKRDIDGPFQVAAGDLILWNEYVQRDSEIWMAEAAG